MTRGARGHREHARRSGRAREVVVAPHRLDDAAPARVGPRRAALPGLRRAHAHDRRNRGPHGQRLDPRAPRCPYRAAAHDEVARRPLGVTDGSRLGVPSERRVRRGRQRCVRGGPGSAAAGVGIGQLGACRGLPSGHEGRQRSEALRGLGVLSTLGFTGRIACLMLGGRLGGSVHGVRSRRDGGRHRRGRGGDLGTGDGTKDELTDLLPARGGDRSQQPRCRMPARHRRRGMYRWT